MKHGRLFRKEKISSGEEANTQIETEGSKDKFNSRDLSHIWRTRTIAEACLIGDKGKHALYYLCIKRIQKEPKLNSG